MSGAAAGELTATGCSVSGCSITVSGSVPGSMYTVSVVAISNAEKSSPAVGSSNTSQSIRVLLGDDRKTRNAVLSAGFVSVCRQR